MVVLYMYDVYTVWPEILAVFKFGCLVPSGRNKNIGSFKFGSYSRLLTYNMHAHVNLIHIYVRTENMHIRSHLNLTDLNLTVASPTAKFNSLPIFPAMRYIYTMKNHVRKIVG